MSTVDEQLANVAAFHRLSEQLPGLSMDEWRKLVAPWKARMSTQVQVGALRKLLGEHERLTRMEASVNALAAKWRAGIDDNWEDYPVVESALDELLEAAKGEL